MGGQDLSADLTLVQRHCDGLTVGIVKGGHAPAAVGSCKMPRPREFPNDTALFAALRSNELTAAWTTTANPGIPGDLVVLADASKNALIRAENVVPLYRRNALTTRQLLAINEVAGVLDTEALTDLWRKVAGVRTRRRWPTGGSGSIRWDADCGLRSGPLRAELIAWSGRLD